MEVASAGGWVVGAAQGDGGSVGVSAPDRGPTDTELLGELAWACGELERRRAQTDKLTRDNEALRRSLDHVRQDLERIGHPGLAVWLDDVAQVAAGCADGLGR
jgi:hypothetical protein